MPHPLVGQVSSSFPVLWLVPLFHLLLCLPTPFSHPRLSVIGYYHWLHALVPLYKPGPSNCRCLCLWTCSVCGCNKPHWNPTQTPLSSSVVSKLPVVHVCEWLLCICLNTVLMEALLGGYSESSLACFATLWCFELTDINILYYLFTSLPKIKRNNLGKQAHLVEEWSPEFEVICPPSPPLNYWEKCKTEEIPCWMPLLI